MSEKRKMRKIRRRKHNVIPGATPGTLNIDPNAPKPSIHAIGYGPAGFQEYDVKDPGKLKSILGKFPGLWVNVDGLGDEGILLAIAKIFNIHPLALEDIVHTTQRAKVDYYEPNFFIFLRMFSQGETITSEQVSLILGENFVLSFQERPGDCFDPIRERIRKGLGRVRASGSDYLAYVLMDSLVDHYFPLLESYGDRLDWIEEHIFSSPSESILNDIHEIKQGLQSLKRAIWPTRELVNHLYRDDSPLIQNETRAYFRDCYDHTIQIMDLVDTNKEMCSDLSNLYLSSLSNRMNEIMKVLTMIATLFIPLSFVAGIYGMNFNPDKSPLNMPELNWFWGYPFALGLMATISGGLIWFFVRKGWLGKKN
jgi:magnesium transporter